MKGKKKYINKKKKCSNIFNSKLKTYLSAKRRRPDVTQEPNEYIIDAEFGIFDVPISDCTTEKTENWTIVEQTSLANTDEGVEPLIEVEKRTVFAPGLDILGEGVNEEDDEIDDEIDAVTDEEIIVTEDVTDTDIDDV